MNDINNMTTQEIIDYLKKRDHKEAVSVISEHIESHLKASKIELACPNCGSTERNKNGSNKSGVIRYKCKKCGKGYTALTNTVFDGTDYTWDEMVNAVHCVISKDSLEYMVANIGTSSMKYSNVWLLQMKILCILAKMPKPMLHGVIQVDEKYFRENQKGDHALVSFLDNTQNRRARRHNYRSECGIFGPEFINVLCAVDNQGHHYAKCVCLGSMTENELLDLEDHIGDISYLCTDNLEIYYDLAHKNKWQHYVEPTRYRKERKARGYIDTDNIYRQLTADEVKKDKAINMQLYKEGIYPHIENSDKTIDYDAFIAMKYKFGLNINAVNSFHAQLERDIVKNKSGVASKYLPTYIDAYTYLANYKAKHHIVSFSKKDAEDILIEMCKLTLKDKFIPTKTYIEELNIDDLPRPSKKMMKEARRKMAKARTIVNVKKDDKDQSAYEGDDEIAQFIFNKRKFFDSLGAKRINELIKTHGLYVKGATKRAKIDKLCALPNAENVIFYELYLHKYGSIEEFEKAMKDGSGKKKKKKP